MFLGVNFHTSNWSKKETIAPVVISYENVIKSTTNFILICVQKISKSIYDKTKQFCSFYPFFLIIELFFRNLSLSQFYGK